MDPHGARQCQVASAAVNEMTNWCLGGSVKDDGSLVSPDKSDPIPDYFYYAASFLDTIGYFNKKKRFWTAGVPPGDPTKIRTGMIAQLKIFNPYYTEVDDALVRFGASEHPWDQRDPLAPTLVGRRILPAISASSSHADPRMTSGIMPISTLRMSHR